MRVVQCIACQRRRPTFLSLGLLQVLFPYAEERLRSHLEATFDTADTQEDIQLFREQVGLRDC